MNHKVRNVHNILMIDNLFYDELTNAMLRVDEIHRDKAIFYVIDRNKYPLPDGWKARPIPLLPHIMKMIGFKEPAPRCFIHPKFGMIELIYIEAQGHYLIKTSTGIPITSVSVLHDLQNIYLLLTGEPLDVSVFDNGKVEI